MADLLHRLAARTLGHAPALTPRIPTRFEPAAEPSIVDIEAPMSTVDVERPATSAMPAPMPAAAPVAGEGAPTTPAGPVPPRPGSPAVPVGERSGRVEPDRLAPAPPPRLVTPEFVLAVHAAEPVAAPAALFPAGPPNAGDIALLPPMPPPAPASPRRGAPAAPPDVHITIGRIEVRAEPAAPAPAPAAPRPQPAPRPPEPPAVTLSAYLRGDDGRPR
jgi:hypothetical protein